VDEQGREDQDESSW